MSYVLRPGGASLPIDLSSASEVENTLGVGNGGTGSATAVPSLGNILVAGPPIPDSISGSDHSITINLILAQLRAMGAILP